MPFEAQEAWGAGFGAVFSRSPSLSSLSSDADSCTSEGSKASPADAMPLAVISGSPDASSASMMRRMHSVLRRRQCSTQLEELSACAQRGGSGSAAGCAQYLQAFRYCELQVQQHNFPANHHYVI